MTVNEFVTLMETNREQFDEVLGAKYYIPVAAKKVIVDAVIKESLLYEDEVYKFDGIKQYVALIMCAIEAFTELDVNDDYVADYDALCTSGLLKDVVDRFVGEYEVLRAFLQLECDNILAANTVESKVGEFLSHIEEKFDEVFDGASSLLSSIKKEDIVDLIKGLGA